MQIPHSSINLKIWCQMRDHHFTTLPAFLSGPYSATVKVPVTSFGMRANAPVREPEIQSFWEQRNIYESLIENNPGVSRVKHWHVGGKVASASGSSPHAQQSGWRQCTVTCNIQQ